MQLIGISCHIIAHNHAGTAWTFSLRGEVKAVHSPKVQPKAEETGIMGTVVEGGKEVGETEGGERKKKDSWHRFSPGHPQQGEMRN